MVNLFQCKTMRNTLTIIIFFIFGQHCYATNEGWFYIYKETEYPQGPWTRTNILEQSGSYKYLEPKQFEELLGSEKNQLANYIFYHLQRETENPKLYKFKNFISISLDTVILQSNEIIPEFEKIKNELVASFTLNNFTALKVIQGKTTRIYKLSDITIPYMDLVYYSNQSLSKNDDRKTDSTSINMTQRTDSFGKNKFLTLLILSFGLNIIFITFILLKRK